MKMKIICSCFVVDRPMEPNTRSPDSGLPSSAWDLTRTTDVPGSDSASGFVGTEYEGAHSDMGGAGAPRVRHYILAAYSNLLF